MAAAQVLDRFRPDLSLAAWTAALVSVATGIVLFLVVSPEHLNTDTAQYVVTARHLLRGEGLSTSLIYFEEQMAAGVVPAPQTVWPPGYPVLVAVLMAAGVSFDHAPFVMAIVSHVATALVLYGVLRRLNCAPALAASGAVVYVLSIVGNVLTLRGLSESTYTLCTVLCVWILSVSAGTAARRQWLLLAGVAAAAAFLMRYAGIVFVAALGLVVGVRWLLERSARAWWDAVVAMAVPSVCVAWLFVRNYAVVGSVTGGPSLVHGSSLMDVARSMRWSFEQMAGIYDGFGQWLCVVIVAAFLWVAIELLAQLRSGSVRLTLSGPVAQVVLLSCAYILLTVIMYGYLAYRRQPEMITPRYLFPLLPFLLILACTAIAAAWRSLQDHSRRRLALGGIAAAAMLAFLAAQAHAIGIWQEWFRGDRKFATMIEALEEPVEPGRTLRELIVDRVEDGAVLAVDGQLLGMWLDVPAVGLTESAWTSKTWNEAQVHELTGRFDVRLICEFPTIFDENATVNRHREFFIQLKRRDVPPWLTLIAQTPSARIYSVSPAT